MPVYVIYSVSNRRHVIAEYYSRNGLLNPCSAVYSNVADAFTAAMSDGLQIVAIGDGWTISAAVKKLTREGKLN